MKKLILLFLTCYCIHTFSFAQQDQIKAKVEPELISFLSKIPAGQELEYGFDNREQIQKATLGTIFRTFTILNDTLATTNEYRGFVLVDGVAKGLVTIAKQNGNWAIVGYGAVELAKEIQNQFNSIGFDKKIHTLALLRLFEKQSDFIAIHKSNEKLQNVSFFPLKSARMSLVKSNARMTSNFQFSDIVEFNRKK